MQIDYFTLETSLDSNLKFVNSVTLKASCAGIINWCVSVCLWPVDDTDNNVFTVKTSELHNGRAESEF